MASPQAASPLVPVKEASICLSGSSSDASCVTTTQGKGGDTTPHSTAVASADMSLDVVSEENLEEHSPPDDAMAVLVEEGHLGEVIFAEGFYDSTVDGQLSAAEEWADLLECAPEDILQFSYEDIAGPINQVNLPEPATVPPAFPEEPAPENDFPEVVDWDSLSLPDIYDFCPGPAYLPPVARSRAGAKRKSTKLMEEEVVLGPIPARPRTKRSRGARMPWSSGVLSGLLDAKLPRLVPDCSFVDAEGFEHFIHTPTASAGSSCSSDLSPLQGQVESSLYSFEGKAMGQGEEGGASSASKRGSQSGGEGGVARRCTHCSTTKTPQWRAGPHGPKTLCNACGVRFKSGRLCAEYRPASSPEFEVEKHSNSHRKIVEMRKLKDGGWVEGMPLPASLLQQTPQPSSRRMKKTALQPRKLHMKNKQNQHQQQQQEPQACLEKVASVGVHVCEKVNGLEKEPLVSSGENHVADATLVASGTNVPASGYTGNPNGTELVLKSAENNRSEQRVTVGVPSESAMAVVEVIPAPSGGEKLELVGSVVEEKVVEVSPPALEQGKAALCEDKPFQVQDAPQQERAVKEELQDGVQGGKGVEGSKQEKETQVKMQKQQQLLPALVLLKGQAPEIEQEVQQQQKQQQPPAVEQQPPAVEQQPQPLQQNENQQQQRQQPLQQQQQQQKMTVAQRQQHALKLQKQRMWRQQQKAKLQLQRQHQQHQQHHFQNQPQSPQPQQVMYFPSTPMMFSQGLPHVPPMLPYQHQHQQHQQQQQQQQQQRLHHQPPFSPLPQSPQHHQLLLQQQQQQLSHMVPHILPSPQAYIQQQQQHHAGLPQPAFVKQGISPKASETSQDQLIPSSELPYAPKDNAPAAAGTLKKEDEVCGAPGTPKGDSGATSHAAVGSQVSAVPHLLPTKQGEEVGLGARAGNAPAAPAAAAGGKGEPGKSATGGGASGGQGSLQQKPSGDQERLREQLRRRQEMGQSIRRQLDGMPPVSGGAASVLPAPVAPASVVPASVGCASAGGVVNGSAPAPPAPAGFAAALAVHGAAGVGVASPVGVGAGGGGGVGAGVGGGVTPGAHASAGVAGATAAAWVSAGDGGVAVAAGDAGGVAKAVVPVQVAAPARVGAASAAPGAPAKAEAEGDVAANEMLPISIAFGHSSPAKLQGKSVRMVALPPPNAVHKIGPHLFRRTSLPMKHHALHSCPPSSTAGSYAPVGFSPEPKMEAPWEDLGSDRIFVRGSVGVEA